ncbi:MAG: Mur ligase family protein [Coriobacteriia bacterium]|nr:Mur ligase family protein [Coriobacteriia bacterium]
MKITWKAIKKKLGIKPKQVKTYTFGQVCKALDAQPPAGLEDKLDQKVSLLSPASKLCVPGSVYMVNEGYATSKVNVTRAFRNGALCAVAPFQLVDENDAPVPCIIHPDAEGVMAKLCHGVIESTDVKTVCITGSVGKTSVKTMMDLVSRSKFQTVTSRSNQNGFGQAARYAQNLTMEDKVYIQETGMSRPGRLGQAIDIIHPNVFVITNIGLNHVGKFGGKQENILHEKLVLDRLAADDGVGFVNWDDPLLKTATYQHKVYGCAVDDATADYHAENVVERNACLHFDVVETATGQRTPVKLNVVGRHNVFNAVVAFAFGLYLGVDRATIAKALLGFRTEGVRQNYTEAKGQRLYLDCYNASEGAINSVLDTIGTIDVPEGAKRVLVLGDIDDKLGDRTEEIHRRVGRTVAAKATSDLTLFFGNHMLWAAEDAKAGGAEVLATEDRGQLEEWIREHVGPGDLVAFKGGQQMELSRTVDAIFDTPYFLLDGDVIIKLAPVNTHVGNGEYRKVTGYGLDLYRVKKGVKEFTAESVVDGMELRAMSRGAALERQDLEKVTLPAPLRSIGQNAFYRCTSLRSVELPGTLRFIGRSAFNTCRRLETVVIPEGVHTLDERSFAFCKRLRSVELPASLKTIGPEAFLGTEGVTFTAPAGSFAAEHIKANYPEAKLVEA